jgi:uncharacterized membrane protein
MNYIKTLFNFSNTINGIDFLIRWILSFSLQFVGGFILGISISDGDNGMTVIGLTIAAVGLALQLSSLVKRSRSLFGKGLNYTMFITTYLVLSVARAFVDSFGDIFNWVTIIGILSMFGYLIFKNSHPTEEHIG